MIQPLQIPARGLVFDALAAGPPTAELVMLLHGFPQTSACWTPLLETLAVAGYRAVAPDQRGYSPGARPTAVQAYRMPELVADVVAIADRLGAARMHLVGHDWGGVVAWRLAGRHPERVATLTAVSTPHPRAFARALVAGTQALRSAYIPVFRIPRLAELLLGARRQRGLHWLLAQDGLGAEWVDTYARALAEPGALSAALAWYRAATPFGLRVPRVGVPTLYVWGSGDAALGPRAATTTGRWVTGAYRFEVLPGAGHWLPEHHAEELGRLLLEHLRRWAPGRRAREGGPAANAIELGGGPAEPGRRPAGPGPAAP
jgi:pimeloyl-ACP methyl ester carboxylesterase